MSSIQTENVQIKLVAPIAGNVIALEAVPDPAFAQKMVGDGIAVDPVEGRLCAPCSGTIAMLHPAKHAVSMQTPQGLEILMHIGVDTVQLGGADFRVAVEEGQHVKEGELLIEFDLDELAQKAQSLITPILITNQDQIASLAFDANTEVEIGQPLITAKLNQQQEVEAFSGESIRSQPLAIANPTGIHARPAAYFINEIKPFSSQITLHCGQRSANARSVVALMGLNLVLGDEVVIEAHGTDAANAIAACETAIRSGLGEEVQVGEATTQPQCEEEASLLLPKEDDPKRLRGVSASPGLAVGPLAKIENTQFDYPATAVDSEQQKTALQQALANSKQNLMAMIGLMQQKQQTEKAEIMGAHLELIDDPALYEESILKIESGSSAPAAWQLAIEQQVEVLLGLNNPLMQARAADLRDVGSRVIRQLLGIDDDPIGAVADGSIIVSQELTPSEVAVLDPKRVAGIVTTGGSASSHAAILARSQGIPMLAAADTSILSAEDGTMLLLDAAQGILLLDPSEAQLTGLNEAQAAAAKLQQEAQATAQLTATTQDGVHIEVAANIGNVKEAKMAAENGAEGIGLLRSEFLYLDRVTAPDEEAQFSAYKEMLEGIGRDKSAIVRTLDVGGDKPLAYLPLPKEENPFLGERGIRIGLDRPSLLRSQFRALLRAASFGKLRIMLPMISSIDELRLARQILEQERNALGAPEVELGVMIEVPSAAMMADVLAEEADFFSIGTNDLSQYTLAIDRGNARLAPLVDNLNPAVLRLIDMTVKGAKKHNRWVGVCGGMAGDPAVIPLLMGLGVDELSVSVPAVAEIKYHVRSLNMAECQALAVRALNCRNVKEVKDVLNKMAQ